MIHDVCQLSKVMNIHRTRHAFLTLCVDLCPGQPVCTRLHHPALLYVAFVSVRVTHSSGLYSDREDPHVVKRIGRTGAYTCTVGVVMYVLWVWLCMYCGCGYVCTVGVVMYVLWVWLCMYCGCDHEYCCRCGHICAVDVVIYVLGVWSCMLC